MISVTAGTRCTLYTMYTLDLLLQSQLGCHFWIFGNNTVLTKANPFNFIMRWDQMRCSIVTMLDYLTASAFFSNFAEFSAINLVNMMLLPIGMMANITNIKSKLYETCPSRPSYTVVWWLCPFFLKTLSHDLSLFSLFQLNPSIREVSLPFFSGLFLFW